MNTKETKKKIIQAGQKAVEELIKVAKEKIVDSDDDVSADRLKNAAATKKLAIMDAFEILTRIQDEENMLNNKPKKGFVYCITNPSFKGWVKLGMFNETFHTTVLNNVTTSTSSWYQKILISNLAYNRAYLDNALVYPENLTVNNSKVLNSLKVTKHFLFNLRFEAFAVGGLGAYFFIEKKESVLYYVNQPMIKYLNAGLLILTMGLGNASQLLHLFFAGSFAFIIVSLASKNQPIFFLDNFIIRYIGKISYGLYMYQLPVIYVVSNLLRPYYTSSNLLSWNIIYYICLLYTSDAADE